MTAVCRKATHSANLHAHDDDDDDDDNDDDDDDDDDVHVDWCVTKGVGE